MKKLIIALAVMASISTARAESEIELGLCSDLSDLADMIMSHRQSGTPMQRLIDILSEDDMLMSWVLEAYDSSRFDTPKYRERAVQDFREEKHVSCLRATRSGE